MTRTRAPARRGAGRGGAREGGGIERRKSEESSEPLPHRPPRGTPAACAPGADEREDKQHQTRVHCKVTKTRAWRHSRSGCSCATRRESTAALPLEKTPRRPATFQDSALKLGLVSESKHGKRSEAQRCLPNRHTPCRRRLPRSFAARQHRPLLGRLRLLLRRRRRRGVCRGRHTTLPAGRVRHGAHTQGPRAQRQAGERAGQEQHAPAGAGGGGRVSNKAEQQKKNELFS